ncbi:hypothetical protein HED60_03050 [Planctomycetales bacterium ZRK34]|nr:hypothetical protein HED60_03050 [Planctomycetales bacterium ZRK34]
MVERLLPRAAGNWAMKRQAKIMRIHTAIIVAMACIVISDGPRASAQPFAPRHVPTPDMAMAWKQEKDSRKWTAAYKAGNETRIIMEFVPQGDDIEAWKELVIHQIDFTPRSLREYVDAWKAMLVRADPKIKITEEKFEDGSFLMTFESITPEHQSDEFCVRRFIKGSDGIYQLAYSVRPSLKKENIVKLWTEILTDARLVPNPQKKSK